MPKRRRERDRPKAGPDAPYDPNKRVLLSYASDDEDVEDASEQQMISNTTTTTTDANVADYQFDEYPHEEDDGDAELGATEEAAAATADAVLGGFIADDVEVAVDSAAKSTGSKQSFRKNQLTGQKPALGLASYQDDESDPDEEYDSSTEDAMAYLRGVRTERQMLPEVLTANGQVTSDANGNATADAIEGDDHEAGGYFLEDGGYVGAPTSDSKTQDDLTDPQKAFTHALRQRFLLQRKQLHLPTTVEALAALGDGHPISFSPGNSKAYAEWHRLLSAKKPNVTQLRSLEQDTVFALLALLQKQFMRKDENIDGNVSAWVWSLLARLDDVGNMTNDQVYPLREFGKRALFLQLSFLKPEIAAQLEAVGQTGTPMENDDGLDGVDEVPDPSNGAQPKAVSNALSRDQVSENTLATLDTILVVIGEVFGQRDVLEFRQPWSVATEQV